MARCDCTILALSFTLALLVQGTLGGIICEQLSRDECAFAISNSGKRCVLEKYVKTSGLESYKCTTSDIEADKLQDLIETSHCIEACGLDRDTIGISSDSLLESRFTQKLCSSQCYQSCPNVVDLYFNLAAGEGVYLPKLCEHQGKNARRGLAEIQSSGIVAPGPVSGANSMDFLSGAPLAPAPVPGINSMDFLSGVLTPAMAPATAPATVPATAPAI